MPRLHPANIMHFIDKSDREMLAAGIAKVDKLEKRWARKLQAYIDEQQKRVLASLGILGFEIPEWFDCGPILAEHYFETISMAFKDAEATAPKSVAVRRRLARDAPAAKMPRSLKEMMKLWDNYRKGHQLPRRQKTLANRIKKAYIDKLKKVYAEYSEEFRTAKVFDQEEVVQKIKAASVATNQRAKIIVATETTRFFNEGRREIYDQSDDVTHYLFLAIRDHRTTKWCKTRHGLVYAKGDPLLDKETPPIHYFCRSEVLPLTPLNPKHLILIKNSSIQRRNNSPEPLMRKWNS